MVSDFISEKGGYLRLTMEEFNEAKKQTLPSKKKHASSSNMERAKKVIGQQKGS